MNNHPFALILALIPASVAVILWFNPVSAAVALLGWVMAALLLGLGRHMRTIAVGAVCIAAIASAVSMALYGRDAGELVWQFGPVTVSDGSINVAFITAIRVLALAIPAVVLFRAIDVTRLADAFEQTAHTPATIVWGSFAGFRQLELARVDWQTVSLSRRARGLARQGRIRNAGEILVAMFALAIERGGELAITMHARGLGVTRRVPARPIRWRTRDSLILLYGILLGILTAMVALQTGGSVA